MTAAIAPSQDVSIQPARASVPAGSQPQQVMGETVDKRLMPSGIPEQSIASWVNILI